MVGFILFFLSISKNKLPSRWKYENNNENKCSQHAEEWMSKLCVYFGWDDEEEENIIDDVCCSQENRIHLLSFMFGWYKTTESYSMLENFHQFSSISSGGNWRNLTSNEQLSTILSYKVEGSTKVFHLVFRRRRRFFPLIKGGGVENVRKIRRKRKFSFSANIHSVKYQAQ